MRHSIHLATIISLILCTVQPAKAQLRWGVQGGANIAGQTLDRLYDLGTDSSLFFGNPTQLPKIAFHVGLYGEWIVLPEFSIQSGLLYSAKGTRFLEKFLFTNSGERGRNSLNVNLSYIEVPLSLVFRMPFPQGNLRIGGGGYAAYLLSGKIKGKRKLGDQTDETSRSLVLGTEPEDDINPLDYGFTIDIGFDIYPYIFTTAFRQGIDLGNGSFIQNQSVSISLVYLFPYGEYKPRKVKSWVR